MKLKKVVTLLLIMTMLVTLFAGCGNSEKTAAETAAPAAEETTAATESEAVVYDEISDVNLSFIVFGPEPAGLADVENAINAISEKAAGVRINLEAIDVGSYGEQVNLKISSGEKLDIMMITPIPNASFQAFTAQNKLIALDDLLPEFAPETVSTVGELMNAAKINGKTYAIPTYRDLVSSDFIEMRTDLLQQAGVEDLAKNMKSYTEYESVLKAIKEKTGVAGLVSSNGQGTIFTLGQSDLSPELFADHTTFDALGDQSGLIAVDPATDKVYNYYASAGFKNAIVRAIDWWKKGYIYKDTPTTDEMGFSLIKSGVGFSLLTQAEGNAAANFEQNTGYKGTVVKLVTPAISTSNAVKFSWGVPVTATEPEAAVRFLNLMYTNKDIENLLAWGIEGTDYVVVDGVASFPEGKDPTTVAYHTADFLWGNQFLAYPWQTVANQRVEAEAALKAAGVSKYLGFSCDTSKISNELTAIANVSAEYKKALECGSIDISNYDKFIAKLKEAGVDKVITEYQTQLDAWKAAN